MYIHERDNWTNFRWDTTQVSLLQEKVFRKQGLLYGRLSSLGFDSKLRAMAENLTYDVVCSSEIEGIRLNVDQVRSSIARKLGIENVKYTAPSHYAWATLAKCSKDTAIRDIQDLVDKNILREDIPGAKRPS